MSQSQTIILLPDQLPIDVTFNSSDVNSDSNNDEFVCGYCHKLPENTVYVYSNPDEDDYWYLCEPCFNHQIRFCQYTNRFFSQSELVKIDKLLTVHHSLTDFIETYRILTDLVEREKYLVMHGITRNVEIFKQVLSNQGQYESDV